MQEIVVEKASGEDIFHELHSIYCTLKQLSKPDKKVVFNLKRLDKIHPALAMAISAYTRATGSKIVAPDNPGLRKLLEDIEFPTGTNPLMGNYKLAGPATPITIIQKTRAPNEREKMLYRFFNLILKFIKNEAGLKSAFYYPISELVENIFEHSKKNIGLIYAQHFKKTDCLEICIADTGRGIRQAYEDELGLSLDYETALAHAMAGESTKSSDRGFGLRTSKDLICRGLGGEFMLISGQSAYAVRGKDEISPVIPEFNWQGTLIYYKFPRPTSPVNINLYLE